MMELIEKMFSFRFMVRALLTGGLLSLCAALLGVSLVLKRFSMIGDGLSHVGFGALAIAAAANLAPLAVAIPIVVIAAFFLLRINNGTKIKGDSAIALVSTSSLAVGVVVLSLTTGMTTDVNNYMFGSILSLSEMDMWVGISVSAVILILFILFYHRIFAVTFDEGFSSATGIKTELYHMVIAMLTAVTIVLGMRLMGALLISSLIIFPALTAMRLFKNFFSVVVCAAVVSVVCFLAGLLGSYLLATPTGASIVVANMIVFMIFSCIKAVTVNQ